jgi:predicted 3-demethylubiquinone-9 3-methyltransferase (glyoxalase superfamily)
MTKKAEITALNADPFQVSSEAISLYREMRNADRVDHYWDNAGEGGDERARLRLKDKYGVSAVQIVPTALFELMGVRREKSTGDASHAANEKVDVAALRRAMREMLND